MVLRVDSKTPEGADTIAVSQMGGWGRGGREMEVRSIHILAAPSRQPAGFADDFDMGARGERVALDTKDCDLGTWKQEPRCLRRGRVVIRKRILEKQSRRCLLAVGCGCRSTSELKRGFGAGDHRSGRGLEIRGGPKQ